MLSRERANAMLLSAVILCVGLAAILVYVWTRSVDPGAILDMALADPEIKREVVSELVNMSYGVYDSHPDPDVGRVFQPNIDKQQGSLGTVTTNEAGFRERPFVLPKPQGTVRVVVLGDSYVYGNMVAADERMGVYLERFLQERAGGGEAPIECLHIGIPSWNILSECAYMRRRITDFQPDLVVQIVVPNDLDDLAGVRGFGVLSTFNPRYPQYGSSLISRTPGAMSGIRSQDQYLLDGLDHESRSRYRESRMAIMELAELVESMGGRYVLMLNWMAKLDAGRRLLAVGLSDEQLLPLPFSLFLDESLKIAKNNGHWNPAGHRRIALDLYSFIQRNRLLPGLSLSPWPEADEVSDALAADVRAQLDRDLPVRLPPRSSLDFQDWTVGTVDQIYGGVLGVMVAPRASLVLALGGGRKLRMEGQFVDSPALAEATVRVYVEDRELPAIVYKPGQPFVYEVDLPPDLVSASCVNVRLETDDFIHGGHDGRFTLSLLIATVAIVE